VRGVGLFLTATAVRDVAPERLAAAITDWCAGHFVVCEQVECSSAQVPWHERVQVHQPRDGWTCVVWPTYFGLHDLVAAEHLARTLGTVVETAGVHDSDCWWHCLYAADRVVDRYVTGPEWFASDLTPVQDVARRWAGQPEAVAHFLGVSGREIARLYRRQRSARHFDDWAFVELWRRMGITYPVEEVPVAATLSLPEGSDRLLPHNGPA
jgi:hypothetical protein